MPKIPTTMIAMIQHQAQLDSSAVGDAVGFAAVRAIHLRDIECNFMMKPVRKYERKCAREGGREGGSTYARE